MKTCVPTHVGILQAMDMIPSGCAEADTLPLMWVKHRHKLPKENHHFYRWYVYHSQENGWFMDVYGIVLPTSNRVVRCKALWQKTLEEIYEFAAPEDDDLPEVPYCGGSTWEPVRFSGRGVYGTHGMEDFFGTWIKPARWCSQLCYWEMARAFVVFDFDVGLS